MFSIDIVLSFYWSMAVKYFWVWFKMALSSKSMSKISRYSTRWAIQREEMCFEIEECLKHNGASFSLYLR